MSVQKHLLLFPHAGNFQGQRLLLLVFSVHSKRDGPQAKCVAKVPVYVP